MTIEFTDVGKDKKSWSVWIPDNASPEIIEREVLKSIKKSRALMSRFPDFEIDPETGRGFVLAGFRAVGRITLHRASEVLSG